MSLLYATCIVQNLNQREGCRFAHNALGPQGVWEALAFASGEPVEAGESLSQSMRPIGHVQRTGSLAGASVKGVPSSACLGLRSIDVTACSLGAAGATRLAAALERCSMLEDLQCSGNDVRSEGAAALASSLSMCLFLTRLNELQLPDTDDLRQAVNLHGIVREPHYETSWMVRRLDELASDRYSCKKSPRKEPYDTQGVPLTRAHLSMATLDLRWNSLGLTRLMEPLAEALKKCESLCSLNLSCNLLDVVAGEHLRDGIRASSCLGTLLLAGNKLGGSPGDARDSQGVTHGESEGLESEDGRGGYLAGLIYNLSSLTVLNLAVNNITQHSMQGLGSALSSLYKLRELNLQGNRIGAQGATLLAPALTNLTLLAELVLGGNQIGSRGAAALAASIRPSMLPHLRNLRVWQNALEDEGATAIVRGLAASTSMTALDFEECGITEGGARAIVDGCRLLPSLTALDLRWNDCANIQPDTLLDPSISPMHTLLIKL